MKTNYLLIFSLSVLITAISCEFEIKSNHNYNKKFSECNSIHDLKLVHYGDYGEKYVSFFQDLRRKDLDSLINHGSSVEKIYSFWAFARIDSNIGIKYLPKLLMDTSKVQTPQMGCLIMPPSSVGDYCKRISENEREEYGCFQLDQTTLDSFAIDLNWNMRLYKMSPNLKLYEQLKNSIKENNNPWAIIAISKYKNGNDIPLIQNLLHDSKKFGYGLKCVQEFPHPIFEKELLKIFNQELKETAPIFIDDVCRALIHYESKEINDEIMKIVSNPEKHRIHLAFLRSIIYNKAFEETNICKIIESELGIQKVKTITENFIWNEVKEEVETRHKKYNS